MSIMRWDSRCARIEPLLSAWLDGELAASEHDRVGVHLEECQDCTQELAALRAVRSLVRAMPDRRLPEGLRLPRPTTSAPQPARRSAAVVLLAAVVAAALGAGGAALSRPDPEPIVRMPVDVYAADHLVSGLPASLSGTIDTAGAPR